MVGGGKVEEGVGWCGKVGWYDNIGVQYKYYI